MNPSAYEADYNNTNNNNNSIKSAKLPAAQASMC